MVQTPERLSPLFKVPAQLRIALDFLRQKLRDPPGWAHGETAESLVALEGDPEALGVWCGTRLTAEQIRALRKALRLAAQQQRVYKRTVMLSPRAHLLIKTLAEKEGVKMSDVIELHLDTVLQRGFGLTVRTSIDEETGQVDHEIVPLAGEA